MAKNISLFVGIESYGWQESDFVQLALFCKQYDISQVILKVYEITQGYWQSGIQCIEYLKTQNIDVLPYGYLYGQFVRLEVAAIQKLLGMYGKLCLDMEGEFDGKPELVKQYVTALTGHTGELFVSTWSNPVTHNWCENITLLDPIVSCFMPQCYNDTLVKELYAQWPKVTSRIEPTFHVQNTDYRMSLTYDAFSLWEYELVRQSTTELNQYRGSFMASYPVNSKNMIGNYLQVSQFQPQHSEFECGAYAVSLNLRSTNYNVINNDNPYNLIQWAESEYAKYAGSNAANNTNGASVDDMHNMLKDSQSDASGGLHYWDTDISGTSAQDHDIATIKAALAQGYPVIATVSEQSIFDLDLQNNPYWWGSSGTHIITYVGIADDGNLLAVDPANVIRGDGNLQTPKSVQSWPRRYDITKVDNQWATIVKTPWLPPIQSGDPLTWQSYTPPIPPVPQPSPEQVTLLYDEASKQLIFQANNTAIYRITIS